MAMLNSDARMRSIMRLLYYCDLLNDTSTTPGNHSDAAGEIIKSVLDLADYIDIHCIPGNEWELFYELRKHCRLIETLLLAAYPDRETIHQGVHEALEQFCYLLEFWNIPLAALIETFCLTWENTLEQR